MSRVLLSLAAAVALLCATNALAQSIRLVPTANYGASVSPGATTPRVTFVAYDSLGRIRPGAVVRFDQSCTYLQRNEVPPYACASAVTGEPLDVAADGLGIVRSPLYQAAGTVGNAWLNATLMLDGQVLTVPFFFRVGSAPPTMSIVSGNNQQLQVDTTLGEDLVIRVQDDRGRVIAGVPVAFSSTCASSAVPGAPDDRPCVRMATAGGSTDPSGTFRATGSANAIAGSYSVFVRFAGLGAGVLPPEAVFDLANYLPRRLAVEPLKQLGLRIIDAPATCSIDLFQVDPIVPAGKPRMLAIPYGIVRVKIGACPSGATLKFQFLHPGGFPEGAKVWSAAPAWRAIETGNPVAGTSDFTMVDGGAGDVDAAANGRIDAFLAMAFGDPESPDFQSLWWTGFDGNGWGLSIVQHGSVLFPVFFVYDAAGEPTWLVMPAGSWNAARDEYSGALYSPRGKPLSSHRAADLVAGAPAGQATLRFRDAMTMEVDLLMPGVGIRIPLVRQLFGPLVPGPVPRYADMWWPGASRDGWGLVLQQQYATVFALLFTYREDGKPTWVVMPSGYWSDATTLVGNAFTTKSSSWPIEYDASKLTSQQVGAFALRFGAGRLTFDFVTQTRTDRFELTPQPF